MQKFKKGDTVTWRSQSHGNWTRKTGKIVDVLKEFELPFLYANNGGHDFGIQGRPEKSYVVKVGCKHYWPLVKNLKKVK